MQPDSWAVVDGWVSDLLGLSSSDVWQPGRRVVRHVGLAGYPGLWVLRRDDAIRISVPAAMGGEAIAAIGGRAADDLLDPRAWRSFGPTHDWVALGPSVHAFTDAVTPVSGADADIDADADVADIDPALLAPLQAAAGDDDWAESGFAADVPLAFALRDADEVVAAANLTTFLDAPTDVGVLVDPSHRGHGFGTRVARVATAHAVAHHGLARYRALRTNDASRQIADALGFEDRFDQLAVRPRR